MGMEVTDICMDKEPDCVMIYSNGVSHISINETTSQHGTEESYGHIKDNAEVKECEVKECTTENSVDITELFQVDEHKELKIVSSPEKSEVPKVKHDIKKSSASKTATKSMGGNVKTKYTVPQPFALATEKRALYGARPAGSEIDVGSTPVTKPSIANSLQNSVTKKQNEVIVQHHCLYSHDLLSVFIFVHGLIT